MAMEIAACAPWVGQPISAANWKLYPRVVNFHLPYLGIHFTASLHFDHPVFYPFMCSVIICALSWLRAESDWLTIVTLCCLLPASLVFGIVQRMGEVAALGGGTDILLLSRFGMCC